MGINCTDGTVSLIIVILQVLMLRLISAIAH
jgi:hypothetical protein